MKIGIHYIKFLFQNHVPKCPGDLGGFWAVYPLPGDSAYVGGHEPEKRIFDPMMFNELIDGLAKCQVKRTLVAYWRKTDRLNTKHDWTPSLWRNVKGLVYGEINELNKRRILHTSYPRILKRREIDLDRNEIVHRKTLVEGESEEQLQEWYKFAWKCYQSRHLQ